MVMIYITNAPWWLRACFPPGLIWKVPNALNEVYLTFDDGPHKEATPFVLDQLALFDAKATFFCIGENVNQNQPLYHRILAEGHQVGNHTYTHPNGWKTSVEDYWEDVKRCGELVSSSLFRPPYGRITRKQVQAIWAARPDMQIVMWSAVTGDFDVSKSANWCTRKAIQHTRPGRIIVFHDSARAFPRLKQALPATLRFIISQGWRAVAWPSGSPHHV